MGFAGKTHLTVTVDAWTNMAYESVFAFNVITPERRAYYWKSVDLSSEIHSAENIAGWVQYILYMLFKTELAHAYLL